MYIVHHMTYVYVTYTHVCGRLGKLGKSGISHGKGEGHVVHAGINCVCNVCGSTHSCGCVVNGSFAINRHRVFPLVV